MNKLRTMTTVVAVLIGMLFTRAKAEVSVTQWSGIKFSGEIICFIPIRELLRMDYEFNVDIMMALETVFPESRYGVIMSGTLQTAASSAAQQRRIFMAGFPNEGFVVGDKWEGIIYLCGETQDREGYRLRVYTTSKTTADKIRIMAKAAKGQK